MKKAPLYFALFFFFLIFQGVIAANSKVIHSLKPGQTISAEVLNEILESLAYTDEIPTRDDFIGLWNCKKTMTFTDANLLNYPDYEVSVEQNIIYTYTGTLEFTKDIANNYYITDPYPSVIIMSKTPTEYVVSNEIYGTAESYLYFNYQNNGIPGGTIRMPVSFRGENQFILHNVGAYSSIVCSKTNIPPEIPEETTSVLSGNDVLITWVDKSDDETGFVILRRDSLEGQWQEIATVGAGTGVGTSQSYTDTGLSAGTFWYRIRAINANGKSFGSNLTKITIQ